MMATTTILVLFVSGGLMLSNSYEVKQSVMINAPVEKVHGFIADLHQWDQWSPWTLPQEGVNVEFSKNSGLGATRSWKSAEGDGGLSITQCDPQKGVTYRVYFNRKQHMNEANFTYAVKNSQTQLTWSMKGTINTPVVGGYVAYLTEIMTLDLFEVGLANLKLLAEK